MPETTLLPSYQSLGTLSESLYVTAQVARAEGQEGLLLVNRVPHCEETRGFFSALYASFLRRPERSDFLELFSIHQDFYAVFRYNEGPSLSAVCAGCPGAAGRRLKLLIAALFQICSAAGDLPDAVVCSLLQPENLLLDDEENVRLLYQFRPEFLVESAACDIWSEAADLMEFLMARELKSPYHKVLRSIHKKCAAGLYESLPAFINDLENAVETLADTGPVQSLKAFVSRKKARLAQISDIGTITYVASQEEDGGGMQLTDPVPEPSEGGTIFSGLPEQGAELTSEDYIVQPGDTLASICAEYYGSAGYAGLVASFNGLEEDEALDAGSVLLLPLRDQLAEYTGN